MVLYELIGIVRPGRDAREVKEIARNAGTIILQNGGVVRGYTNWGVFLLPRPILKYQSRHHTGHHFIMRFDSNAAGQQQMMRTMGLDPRILRAGLVKIGTKLSEIKDVPGRAEWGVPFGQNRDEEYNERIDWWREVVKERYNQERASVEGVRDGAMRADQGEGRRPGWAERGQ